MITRVALRLPSGRIYSLPGSVEKPCHHGIVYQHALVECEPEIELANVECGFITDKGQFVDRYTAKEIALQTMQIIEFPLNHIFDRNCGEQLYSEDIWPW